MTDNKKPFPITELLGAAKSENKNNNTPRPVVQNPRLPASSPSLTDEIEEIVSRVEAAAVDIAPQYDQWRDMAYALTDALGEQGRTHYHRLSRFYPNYDPAETDRQYTACLNGNGQGVTIKTLFHLAKQAGISVAVPKDSPAGYTQKEDSANGETRISANDEDEDRPLPTFSPQIQGQLPQILEKVLAKAKSPQDADMLLLGSLTVISACLPNVQGLYMGLTYYPNLFTYITAKASTGKGRLNLCRYIVKPIHDRLKAISKAEQEEYLKQLEELEQTTKNKAPKKPKPPKQQLLIIPADVSSTRFYQHLCENNGVGLMFETEGDTLTRAFNSEHGNYSDGFRKAFQHENISYSRRQDKEYEDLDVPKFSVLLSGTPQQVLSLIPDAENGLFSRFIFYSLKMQLEWISPFEEDDEPLQDYFTAIGNEFFQLYQALKGINESDPDKYLRFKLTPAQQAEFNQYFATYQESLNTLFGEDIIASVRRLALITFRTAMILSVLRIPETGDISSVIMCNDTDFHTAMQMAKVLIKHTLYVYRTLPDVPATVKRTPRNTVWEHFYNDLPATFNRQVYLALAKSKNLSGRTADKHIEAYCNIGRLNHLGHDQYAKP